MQKKIVQLSDIYLVGLSVRTNNHAEMKPETGKISPIIEMFYEKGILNLITNPKNPGALYCVYTEFESDETGEYTYFVGAQVESLDSTGEELKKMIIPGGQYSKITVGPGPMPELCMNTWEEIWLMSEVDIGGARSYIADFEIYDTRAADPSNTTFDIYLGLK